MNKTFSYKSWLKRNKKEANEVTKKEYHVMRDHRVAQRLANKKPEIVPYDYDQFFTFNEDDCGGEHCGECDVCLEKEGEYLWQ